MHTEDEMIEGGLDVRLYKRPHGRTQEIRIHNIDEADATWFEENGVRVSMEDCGFDTAVYADCGFRVDDDEDEDPCEIIVLAGEKDCQETMARLRQECEQEIGSGRKRYGLAGAPQ